MKEGRIIIAGGIGVFKLSATETVYGVTLAEVIAQVSALPQDIKVLWIDIEGPGGLKEEGDKIVAWLNTLKKRMEVNTNQIGPIGSVTTKIFLVGQRRVALEDGTDNWFIHNPWGRTEGDAKAHAVRLEGLIDSENELVEYYVANTKLDEDALRPLMDSSASFNGTEAEAFGFATEVRTALNIAAYNTMANEKNPILAKLDELIAGLKGGKPDSSKVLALSLVLSDGNRIAIPGAEDETQLEGQLAYTSDNLGNPTQVNFLPGEHLLRDGRKLVIDDKGKIEKVVAAVAVDPALQVYELRIKELETLIKAKPPEGALTKADLDDAILALRKEIKTTHTPEKDVNKKQVGSKLDPAKSKEWDETLKNGEHLAMRRDDPDRWADLFFNKFGKEPESI